jgi:predicted nucleic acid-binding Zn ribbon protein
MGFFSQQLIADFAKLNIFHVPDLLELVIYNAVNNLRDPKLETMSIGLQGPSFPLDLRSKVFWAVRSKDTWKLKQMLKPFTNIIRNHKDARFEPLTVAMKNLIKALIYKSLVDTQSGDGKKRWFKMTQPGECTMFPFRHCRWCGLITTKEFRLCSMCKEYPEYLDNNYFCSEQCENEALDKQHREEHARFFMLQLNMD